MTRRLVLFIGILLSFHLPTACAASSDWAFVWVSSGSDSYDISQGKASVRILNGKLIAEMFDQSGKIQYRLTGYLVKNKVTAKFNVVGSDYFVNSPFSGYYRKKRWSGFEYSTGRESITLTDGWNFIGICRELR